MILEQTGVVKKTPSLHKTLDAKHGFVSYAEILNEYV